MARLAGFSCAMPSESRRCANKIFDSLSKEQKNKYGITDANEEGAIRAIAEVVQRHASAENNLDVRSKILEDIKGFTSYLENEILKTEILEEDLPEAQKKYQEVIDLFKDFMPGRINTINTENIPEENINELRLAIASYPGIIQSYERYKKDDTQEGGAKTTSISIIIREPVASKEKSPQKKALERINTIKNLTKKVEYRGAEYINEKGDTQYVSIPFDTPQEERKKLQQDLENRGWKPTGRSKHYYNGQEIVTTSVSVDVHGFDPSKEMPVAAAPIGDHVDTVGRMFFDKTSLLWKDDDTLNEGNLQDIIDNKLGGIFSVQGLKNLISDFQTLENELKRAWGDDVVFVTDTLKLFGKTKDAENQDMWIQGSPDLLAIDRFGIVHVIDFKTFKMLDVKGYQNGFQNDSYNRGEDYGKQLSRYIRMLEAYGLTVDNDPYVIMIDTWYDSSDVAADVNPANGESFIGDKYVISREKYKKGKKVSIVDPDTGELITLGEYASKEGNPDRIERYDTERQLLYIEPRLHVKKVVEDSEGIRMSDEMAALRGREKGEIPFDHYVSFEMQLDALSQEEKEAMEWFAGKAVSKKTAQGVVRLPIDDIESHPEVIGSQEIRDLADYLMYTVSWAIDQISKEGRKFDVPERKINGKVYITKRKIGGSQYRGKSHEEIIGLIGIENIISMIFDDYIARKYKDDFPSEEEYKAGLDEDGVYDDGDDYLFENEQEYLNEKAFNEKIAWLVYPKHKKQLIMQGYAKLMALEHSVIPYKEEDTSKLQQETPVLSLPIDPEGIQEDSGDNDSNSSFAESYSEGLSDLEAWMMGQRNYSPKASLAQEIKHLFENIKLVDAKGKVVGDKYGYGFAEHLNATKAIQTVLDICKDCETMDEMHRTLELAAKMPENQWISTILAEIDKEGNEPLKAKFFRHFRKDALIYSISQVKFNKKTGARTVETRIINRKSAYDTMAQSLGADFTAGTVGAFKHKDYDKALALVVRRDGKNVLNTFDEKGRSTVAQLIIDEIGDGDRHTGWMGELNKIWHGWSKQSGISREDYILEELQKKRKDGMSVIEAITNILHGIGVMVPEAVVLKACTSKIGKGYKTSSPGKLLMGAKQIILQLSTMNRKDGIPSGLAGNSAFFGYSNLLEFLSSHVQEYVEASVYQDGKTYYSYTNPSRLGHLIRNLKDNLGTFNEDNGKFQQFIHDQFGRYEGWYKSVDGEEWMLDWLDQFTDWTSRGAEAREALEHKVELSYIGNQYRDLGALGFQLSILCNYLGNDGDPTGTRWFALPTMSNKPTNEFVRMKIYSSHDEIIDKVLMKTFQQEMNRMADVLYHFTHHTVGNPEMDITATKLKNAGLSSGEILSLRERIDSRTLTRNDLITLSKTTSGAKFHFLWYLNNEIATNKDFGDKLATKLNTLLTPSDEVTNDNSSDDAETLDLVRDIISSNMATIVEAELSEMEKIGLLDTEKRKDASGKEVTVLKYAEELFHDKTKNFGTDEASMKEKLRDFIWQDIAANINIIQLTGGDLAYYGNAINYQKRIAQIHSPGLHLMHNEKYDDGFLRSIHISDYTAVSEVLYNAEVALTEVMDKIEDPNKKHQFKMMMDVILKGFNEIDVTDGQSFSSPSSIRKKLALQGEWNEDMEAAWSRIRSGNFDINDLGIMIQPSKPFVTSDMAKYSGSTTMSLRRVPLQDKNSEYLLLLAEAISTGAGKKSKMAAIYKFMEATHQFGDGRQGIDTVHFASVGKVGLGGIIDIQEFDDSYEGSDDDYVDNLAEYLMKHVRRFDSKKESLQEEEDFLAENELAKPRYDVDENELPPMLKWAEIRYNSTYVDTIPVEDYIIQQEVPAHLLNHDQLYGSQIRILGISDITPSTPGNPTIFNVKGQKMTAEELVDEYKNLHAANIRAGFKGLLQEMGLDEVVDIDEETGEVVSVTNISELPIGDEKRNKIYTRLETLLQKELSKDGKYGYDARRACTLRKDEHGNVIDFAVPLMEPCQSSRIQMLLNSIIKKAINKQTIEGGPVVQTTAYDNDLHIRFQDKQGKLLKSLPEYQKGMEESWKLMYKETPLPEDWEDRVIKQYKEYLRLNQAGIAYFECYMSVPSVELERLLTNEDGSMMSFEEAKKKLPAETWKSLTEVIGYRIPTEDKYSMLPLKIVGFVPKAAGQVIMMPKEITYLTGSDFDIDKMYIMKKSFDIEFVPETQYGVTNETAVKEIMNYPGIKDLSKEDKDAIKLIIRNGNKILDKNFKGQVFLTSGLSKEQREKLSDFISWYKDRLFKYSFLEYTDQNSKNSRKAKNARNNRLIDLQWAVLTSEDTASKMLNPGNFIPQKKTGRVIRIIKSGIRKPEDFDALMKMSVKQLDALLENANPHNTTLPSSKIYFQRQNMQGTQMVGIFANNNVSHAFMTFQKVGIDLAKGSYNNSFVFDGVLIGSHEEPTVLDPQIGFNGQLISKTIASFLAASVDTAKDPTLSDMNINTFTGGVAMVLARLGFDTEAIGLFLSQPIIMELSDIFFKHKTDGYYDGDRAIQEMISQLGVQKTELLDNSAIRDSSLSKENFLNHLNDGNFRTDKEQKDYQLRILRGFNTLYTIAKDLQELTFCTKFNSVSNAVGPTIADTIEDKNRVESFKSSSKRNVFFIPQDGDTRGFTSAEEVITNDPILKAFYETTTGANGASEIIFGNFFPHYYQGFQNVLSYFLDNYSKSDRINSKLYNQLLNDYLYFLLTYADENNSATFPYSDESKEYLVKDLINRYNEVKSIKGRRKNLILDDELGANCLRLRRRDEYIATDILVFNGSLLNAESQEQVKVAWSELITMQDPNLSEKQNDKIRRFAVDLFFYSMMRNGFGFSPKTMMHLASTIVKDNARYDHLTSSYLDGLDNLKSVDMLLMGKEIDSVNMIERFLNQFIRNHANNKQLVPNIKSTDSHLAIGKDEIEFSIEEGKEHQLSMMINSETPYRFVSVTTKDMQNKLSTTLYMLADSEDPITKENGESKIRYIKINVLGFVNNFIEYNANSDVQESFYESIRGASADSLEEEQPVRESGRQEQQAGDETYGSGDTDVWNQILRIIKSLEGPQNGKSKESREYRKQLKDAFTKALQGDSDLAKDFLSLLETKDKKEQQKIMDKINEQNPCK